MNQQPFEIDLANAKRHRDKDNSLTNPFYDRQAQILKGAEFGKPLPKELRLGTLPQSRPQIRLSADGHWFFPDEIHMSWEEGRLPVL